MANFDCDLFVIGAGSGGVRASRMAAQRGARVVVAEAGALGGTCVNVGCIPKKLYSYAAHYGEMAEQSHGFGWRSEKPVFDWAVLKQRRATEIKRLNGVYEGLLGGAGVQLLRGWAKVVDAHTVAVECEGGEQRLTARHILLATGGQPTPAQGPGAEWALSSDDMFDLEPFPKRLLVVGAGYIACEFASIFQGLGAEVTLVHRGPQLLEKLVYPRKPITAHVFRAQIATNSIADLDAWLAGALSAPMLAAKPFAHLPVLGVPGWWPDNTLPGFYEDTSVFRSLRPSA